MRVAITSLSSRFYKKDGWTLEILRKYVLTSADRDFWVFDETACGYSSEYYAPDISIRLDLDSMIKDGLIKDTDIDGKDRWGELKHLSPLDALRERLR